MMDKKPVINISKVQLCLENNIIPSIKRIQHYEAPPTKLSKLIKIVFITTQLLP